MPSTVVDCADYSLYITTILYNNSTFSPKFKQITAISKCHGSLQIFRFFFFNLNSQSYTVNHIMKVSVILLPLKNKVFNLNVSFFKLSKINQKKKKYSRALKFYSRFL